MAAATTVTLSLLLLLFIPSLSAAPPSPYLSAATIIQSYQNMLASFKIFVYTPTEPFDFPDAASSLFYRSLLRTGFLTGNPDEAHLFFVPFSPDTPTRSLSRMIKKLRNDYPYWNRTLGADHFFLSPAGIDYSSDRNVLELKKNSVQISVFPVVSGRFVPHKDITLPPVSEIMEAENLGDTERLVLGYLNWDGATESDLVNGLIADGDFSIEVKPDAVGRARGAKRSKFCLFLYGGGEAAVAEAMAWGCVPVVIVDRPVQDLPLMDVLRWSEMALVVKVGRGGARRLKEVLGGIGEEKWAEMRGLGVGASRHLAWNEEPQPLDAFHMVMYQLWQRRHVIRYARREFV